MFHLCTSCSGSPGWRPCSLWSCETEARPRRLRRCVPPRYCPEALVRAPCGRVGATVVSAWATYSARPTAGSASKHASPSRSRNLLDTRQGSPPRLTGAERAPPRVLPPRRRATWPPSREIRAQRAPGGAPRRRAAAARQHAAPRRGPPPGSAAHLPSSALPRLSPTSRSVTTTATRTARLSRRSQRLLGPARGRVRTNGAAASSAGLALARDAPVPTAPRHRSKLIRVRRVGHTPRACDRRVPGAQSRETVVIEEGYRFFL